MHNVLSLAAEVQEFMASRQWRFAFIGGIANLAWGEIRTTRDVDVTLFTSFQNESEFISDILSRYDSRISDATEFALKARVILLRSPNGIGIDIGLAGFPYEEMIVDRRVQVDFGLGTRLWVITAEDLVVTKAFAGRDHDWTDILGVAQRQGSELDWDYVFEHARDLALIKEDDELIPKLMSIREQSQP